MLLNMVSRLSGSSFLHASAPPPQNTHSCAHLWNQTSLPQRNRQTDQCILIPPNAHQFFLLFCFLITSNCKICRRKPCINSGYSAISEETDTGSSIFMGGEKKRISNFPLQNRCTQIFKVHCTCLSCLFNPNLLDQDKE